MLSPEAKELSAKLSSTRQRMEKAKDEVVTLARTAVLVLKDTSKSLADEMERRLFVLDSEAASISEVFKEDKSMEAFIELLSNKS